MILEISFQMKMASPKDSATLVNKGKNIENGLLDEGFIKHYSSSSSNNDTNKSSKPNFWFKNKGLPMMVSSMLKFYKTFKVEKTTTTTKTIVIETKIIQTMTINIKIKTTIRTNNNLTIKHNSFPTITTITTTIMIMIQIKNSLTFMNP